MSIKIKAVIYARVSSREQEETGYSLDAQVKLLKEYADKKGYEVAKVFRITESASGKQIRKTFNEMLAYVEKHKIKMILCEKIDRLTRNLKDAATISDWLHGHTDNEVHFIKENFIVNKNTRAHENLVWDMKVAIARFYTNNLSEEVKKGQAEKLAQGWAPRRPLAGYKSIGEKGHKTHIIDEETAPYIRKMFSYYASGNYSMKALGQKMYEEGFRSYYGKRASKSRIEDILKEPFYYGAIPWNGKIYPGRHEPLVSKELFDKVAFIRNGKTTPKYRRHHFQFQKMMTCGECGCTVTAEIQKGHVYYHCNHYRNCSQKKYTPEEKIEQKLLGVFKFFENVTPQEAEEIRAKIKLNHAQETGYKEKMIKGFSERYNSLQKRLDHLYDDKLDEKISRQFWEKKHAEITAEQEAIQEQLSKLKTNEAKYFELWLDIIDLAFRARELYEKKSPEERRVLLTKLFSNLYLKDTETTYTLKKPVEVLAKRVQEKLDVEKVSEPKKNTAEVVKTGGISLTTPIEPLLGSPEVRNNFRTSKKPSVKPRPGAFDSSSRPLLRDQGSNLGHPP